MTIRDVIEHLERHAAVFGYETPVEIGLLQPTSDRQNLEESLFEITGIEPRFSRIHSRRIAIITEITKS